MRQNSVVEMLESLLEQAKRGELQAVAVAGVQGEEGSVITGLSSGEGKVFTLLGGVRYLEQRLMGTLET